MKKTLTLRELNKGLPLILPFNKWFKAVLTFYIKLSEILNDDLIEIVAAPNEDTVFHGYNVAVLVKSITPEIYEILARIEGEVSKLYNWELSISSYVADNPQVIMQFLNQVLTRVDTA